MPTDRKTQWQLCIERAEAMGVTFDVFVFTPAGPIEGQAYGGVTDYLYVESWQSPSGMHPALAVRILAAAFQTLEAERPEMSDCFDRTVDAEQWLRSELAEKYATEAIEFIHAATEAAAQTAQAAAAGDWVLGVAATGRADRACDRYEVRLELPRSRLAVVGTVTELSDGPVRLEFVSRDDLLLPEDLTAELLAAVGARLIWRLRTERRRRLAESTDPQDFLKPLVGDRFEQIRNMVQRAARSFEC